MNVRIVVADARRAHFFDLSRLTGPLVEGELMVNEYAGLKDTDLETDRPGRRFGGTSGHHHGVDGERSTERHEVANFARRVAERIDAARQGAEFEKLAIVAGPRMLGLLRNELPQSCRNVVVAEVPKDLRDQDRNAIQGTVPADAFFH